MTTNRTIYVCCVVTSLAAVALCGELGSGAKDRARGNNATANLTIVQDIVLQSEVASLFVHPVKCDGDGNVYVRRDVDATSGIMKIDPMGKKRLATFRASSAPDRHISDTGYFTIDSDGSVEQLAYLLDSLDRLVIKFDQDGSYKSSIKLDPPPGFEDWLPTQLAAFGNGDLLVAGHKHDNETHRIKIPFTGLYDPSGRLKKEVVLADDDDLKKMGENQDPHVTDAAHPFGNRAIELGLMETGSDGNLYLMRRLSPAILYAISPAGEIVRRFTVDPEKAGYMPIGLQIAGGRIAVLFYEPQLSKKLFKITDLEGTTLATYMESEKDGQEQLGAFACYAQNPERFTFLYTTGEHSLGLHIAEPR